MGEKKKICLFSASPYDGSGGVANSLRRVSGILSSTYDVHVVNCLTSDDIITPCENISTVKRDDLTIATIELSSYQNIDRKRVSLPDCDEWVEQKRELYISLKRYIEEHSFELLHIFYLDQRSHVACVVARELNIPIISSIRGNDIGKSVFDNYQLPSIEYILKNSTIVTSVAQDLLQTASTLACIGENSAVIHNSIELSEIEKLQKREVKIIDPRPQYRYSRNRVKAMLGLRKEWKPLTIGTLGVFKFKKGLHQLLKAFHALDTEIKDKTRILLVGKFDSELDKVIFEKWLRTYDLHSYVHITEVKEGFTKYDYLRAMDAFVIPSLYSEGCPNTLLEALSQKVPVIGTDAGAIPEIIRDGENGLIAKQADSNSLSAKIKELLQSEDLRKTLGESGYQTVLEMTPSRESERWQSIYHKALNR